MKILYLAAVDNKNPKDIGVIKKINGQINAFNNLDIDVDTIFYNSKEIYFNDNFLFSYKNQYSRRILMFKKILSEINFNSYESIYIRYSNSDPFFINFLNAVKRKKIKVLIELPTYPYDQERKQRDLVALVSQSIDKVCRRFLKESVDNIITFMEYEYIWGIPVIQLQNGIDVRELDFTGYNNSRKALTLTAVANISKWHGYDRILEGLRKYYEVNPDRKVFFNVVGEGDELYNLKSLVDKYNLQSHVIFHGAKSGDELTEIFKSTDIGVGSLGMHRIGINKGSTLKAKEYTARGIPFILGYIDASFKKDEKFICYVSNDDSDINFQEVLSFFDNLKVKGNEIRNIAEENFDWTNQLFKVKSTLIQKKIRR